MTKYDVFVDAMMFEKFPQEELEILVGIAEDRQCAAGSVLFREGDNATAMYIIQDGVVEVSKGKRDDVQFVVTELKKGAVFGEMPFVDASPRAATITAKSKVRLLEISYTDLEKNIGKNPNLGVTVYRAIARTLCTRIRQTTSELSSFVIP
ncbi:MAG: hypothetical protein A2583_14580 [Bdellovibrionales bacterium RIFOXYD1_FULL_53_11]|nr:MAG: hypothetical protein A2583_14580 [Bdellovibrionales bacterium RIFOXYD1_FULL_53_11]